MSTQEAPAEPVIEATTTTEAEGAKPEEPLGEAGLAALKSEREARKAAEKATADALARVKEFEDREKTEAQKQQEALESAQRQLAELTVAKTRAEVSAAKGVPANLLAGSTQEELEASADALIQFKGDAGNRLVVKKEGATTSAAGKPADEFASFLKTQLGA